MCKRSCGKQSEIQFSQNSNVDKRMHALSIAANITNFHLRGTENMVHELDEVREIIFWVCWITIPVLTVSTITRTRLRVHSTVVVMQSFQKLLKLEVNVTNTKPEKFIGTHTI